MLVISVSSSSVVVVIVVIYSMVQCSNDECRNMLGEHKANWFHYACVSFNPDVDTDYYCSDNCRKKKRKNR